MNTLHKVGTLKLIEIDKQVQPNNIVFVNNRFLRSISKESTYETIKATRHFWAIGEGTHEEGTGYDVVKDNVRIYQPIIVCDDEIKTSDKINFGNELFDCINVEKANRKEENDRIYISSLSFLNAEVCRKVIVFPNQFSSEFIQTIVDGKLKDGDKVEVEIEEVEDKGDPIDVEDATWARVYKINQLKLNNNGTAIIHPYKEGIEEIFNKWEDNYERDDPYESGSYNYTDMKNAFIAGVKWAKENKFDN